MVRPERRKPADLVAVVVLVVITVAGGLLIWQHSDARATVSDTAPVPAVTPAPAAAVPPTLTEAWQAPSPATPHPAVAGPAVVTGDGSDVLGRDPATGQVRWRYSRNIPLCTVGTGWGRAIAVYRKWHNCSEVTSLEGSTGVRGPQSNSDADFGTQLLWDGMYVTATGRRIVESWRSDLVRTQEYGVPTDYIYANNNMRRPNCWYASEASGDERVAVIEKCPGDPSDRLTVIRAAPASSETPEEIMTTLDGSNSSNVVAVTDRSVAVVARDRAQLIVYSMTGTVQGTYPVRTGPSPSTGAASIEATSTGNLDYWYTGTDTVALDPETLAPLWTIQGALGPGTMYGGKLLVPVPGGLAVLDPNTGLQERVIPVDRRGYTGPVATAAIGTVLLEQRGSTLIALGPGAGAPQGR